MILSFTHPVLYGMHIQYTVFSYRCSYSRLPGPIRCSVDQSGGFACCGDGSFCPTTPAASGEKSTSSTKDYFLSYTVTYTEVTTDTIPLNIWVTDASNCMVEYVVRRLTAWQRYEVGAEGLKGGNEK